MKLRRATVIDHVVNHDLSTREAGQSVQPNLSHHTVASIVRTFRNDNDTLLAFTVNVLYCVSLYLHSWQQPFLYFCKVCCHNTMLYCRFTKVIYKIYSRILIIYSLLHYFYRINTLAHTGGRGRTFTAEQILPFYCKLKPVILTSYSIYMECGKMTVINIFVSESLPFCTQ